MSKKQVTISQKPQRAAGADVDAWVRERSGEPSKRLTIDIPASLHARFKSRCALQGINMKRAILNLLNEKFPE
ncbi:MAG: hypothetical protein OXN84_07340 [Albidovulum sp.]|nr:hypothetical protein [Albidovulum sp.]